MVSQKGNAERLFNPSVTLGTFARVPSYHLNPARCNEERPPEEVFAEEVEAAYSMLRRPDYLEGIAGRVLEGMSALVGTFHVRGNPLKPVCFIVVILK